MSVKIKIKTEHSDYYWDTVISVGDWESMCEWEQKSHVREAMTQLDISINAVDDDGETLDAFEVR